MVHVYGWKKIQNRRNMGCVSLDAFQKEMAWRTREFRGINLSTHRGGLELPLLKAELPQRFRKAVTVPDLLPWPAPFPEQGYSSARACAGKAEMAQL